MSSLGASSRAGAAVEDRRPVRAGPVAVPDDPLGRVDVRASIDAAAVAHLYEQAITACAINLLVLALMGAALWAHVPLPMLIGWGATIVVLTGARVLLYRAYRRLAAPDARTWAWYYAALVAPSGLAWGLAVPLFVPLLPPLQILVVLVAIGGLVAGALPVHAAVLPIYVAYVACMLVPTAATFVVLGQGPHVILALMAMVYGAALVVAGRAYNRNLRRANELTARLNAANHELERRASHDPLTGLWNRQRFEAALDAELDRVARYGSWCGLIMLDIDHFKQVNDSHGHDIGDCVLTQVGQVLQMEMRTPDHLARWGGEEFMVLLPETDGAAAMAVAERLRARLADTEFDDVGTLTISLGVTTTSAPEERSALLKRLDDALYRAKTDGRNCVRIAPEPEQTAD